MSIPVGLSSDGLPIGLQLLGPQFSEERLLNAAKWLEMQFEFPGLDLDWLDSVEEKKCRGVTA